MCCLPSLSKEAVHCCSTLAQFNCIHNGTNDAVQWAISPKTALYLLPSSPSPPPSSRLLQPQVREGVQGGEGRQLPAVHLVPPVGHLDQLQLAQVRHVGSNRQGIVLKLCGQSDRPEISRNFTQIAPTKTRPNM